MTRKNPFTKKWSVILLLLLLCLIVLQFIRPGLASPPVTGDLAAPPEVKQILERACYDCHSNKTNLTWFDQVVPAYWLVTADILEARKALNFSEWDTRPQVQQNGEFFAAPKKTRFHNIPP